MQRKGKGKKEGKKKEQISNYRMSLTNPSNLDKFENSNGCKHDGQGSAVPRCAAEEEGVHRDKFRKVDSKEK